MVNFIIYSEKAIERNYFIKLASQQYNYSYFTTFFAFFNNLCIQN